MSVSQSIGDYLDSQHVSYERLHHALAFPAQEVAHALHVSGKHFAKAVMLQADGRPVMAVLPASHRLNIQELKVELAANPSYWRGAPPFPRVEMRPVPNEETRIADVRTARADIVRVSSTDTADSLKADSQVKVLFAPVERAAMLMLNALTGPTKDVRVRRAIAHAIDRNLIVEALLKGYARVVDEPLTPANFGWADGLKSYDYDPAAAKALLKEAGIAPGTKVTFPTGPFFDQRVVQAIQQMLADVGLDAQISMTDGPTYLRLRQGRPDEAGDVSFFRWSCGCQDADGVLFPLFHSSSQWAKYSNPSVDAALEAARTSLDPAKRQALYRQVLETLHTDEPAVPLYQDVMMFAARKDVRFQPTPNEAFFLMDMSWNQCCATSCCCFSWPSPCGQGRNRRMR